MPAIIFLNEDELAFTAFLVAVVLLAGNQVGRLRHTRQKLAAQTEVSELEQARRAVLEERARIAREEFAAVARASREALAEMRRLLGVLRSESITPELAPQPDLSAIGDLVAAARRAGMSVHYLPPEPEHLERPPGAVALAGFRIVQEALANATRHAPGAAVTVQIWPGTRELACESTTSRPPTGVPATPPASPVRSRTASATAWPACGSGRRCWAGSSRPGRPATAGSRWRPPCRTAMMTGDD